MNQRQSLILAVSFVCITLTFAMAPAWAELKIDFGVANCTNCTNQVDIDNTNDVQTGWEDWSAPHSGAFGVSGRDGSAAVPANRTFGVFDVTVDGGGAGRDRLPELNEVSSLGDLYEDFWALNSITISGVPAGNYTMTTYHQDTGFGDASAVADGVITLDTGGGASTVAMDLPRSGGFDNMAPRGPFLSVSFPVVANGTDDVVVSMDGIIGNQLNGFSLVPEPSTMILTLLGGLIMVGSLFRRRRT